MPCWRPRKRRRVISHTDTVNKLYLYNESLHWANCSPGKVGRQAVDHPGDSFCFSRLTFAAVHVSLRKCGLASRKQQPSVVAKQPQWLRLSKLIHAQKFCPALVPKVAFVLNVETDNRRRVAACEVCTGPRRKHAYSGVPQFRELEQIVGYADLRPTSPLRDTGKPGLRTLLAQHSNHQSVADTGRNNNSLPQPKGADMVLVSFR